MVDKFGYDEEISPAALAELEAAMATAAAELAAKARAEPAQASADDAEDDAEDDDSSSDSDEMKALFSGQPRGPAQPQPFSRLALCGAHS